jgi:RNA-directed DNA polymerase
MDEKTKNILILNNKEAMDFFLKSEQYHGFELPEYFVFDELLQNVKEAVGDKPYEECLQEGLSPKKKIRRKVEKTKYFNVCLWFE